MPQEVPPLRTAITEEEHFRRVEIAEREERERRVRDEAIAASENAKRVIAQLPPEAREAVEVYVDEKVQSAIENLPRSEEESQEVAPEPLTNDS